MSQRISINGVSLEYDDSSHADPAAIGRTAIVTLHGAPGMSSRTGDWNVFSELSDTYRIISYDQRGSGRSEGQAPFSFEQFCADLEQLRLQLDLGKIILAGGSYGGMIALQYATRFQQNLHAVVLRDTAANSDFEHLALDNALASRFPMDREGLERIFSGHTRSDDDFRELIRMIMPLYTVTYDAERDEKAVAAMHIHHETHNWAFSRNQQNYDVTPLLPYLQVPVLITVGRQDWITPLPASEEIARLVPDNELVIFENSGHSPQNEEREKWLQTVRSFLARRVNATA